MKKKSDLFNTVEFVKYKKTVIEIVGAADWTKAAAMYTTRYRDFDAYRGGYARLMETIKDAKNAGLTGAGLNKKLMQVLKLLKADGFPKVNSKEYKVKESDIKEYMLDGDELPAYGKKDKK